MKEAAEEAFRAVKEGDEGLVSRLLDARPGLLERGSTGGRPLLAAAQFGRLEVVRLLVLRGAILEAPGWLGRTALHYAAIEGHEAVVEFLLTYGAQADTRDYDRRAPFMYASMRGHLGVVRLLLQHTGGQGIDDRDYRDMTALHHAADGGCEEAVKLLLSQGAQTSFRDESGMTPFMLACVRGHLSVVKQFVRHTGGQGLDDRDCAGQTALHFAIYWGHVAMVKFLIFAEADPTITDSKGRTPRDLAQEKEEAPAHMHEMYGAGRARCVKVLDWWEGELERRYVLSRATCLHKAYTTQRDQPTSQVPTYLEARVAAGHAVPFVEVASLQSASEMREAQAAASGKRKAADEGGSAQGAEAGEEEERRNAVLEYVMGGLNAELLTELLEGFRSIPNPASDQEEDGGDEEKGKDEEEV